jgi:hypothetical protein
VLEPDDWHTLLERCLGERQDVLVENVKSAIEVLGRRGLAEALAVGAGDGSAAIGAASPQPKHDSGLLRSFAEASRERLNQRIAESGKDPYPDGSWSFAYAVEPAPEPPVPLPALRRLMHEVVGRETGWPAWWWPSGDGAPQVQGETIECWMAGGHFDDPAHSDFWRASEDGQLYLLRGYDEDAAQALSPAHSNLDLSRAQSSTPE